MKKLLFVMLMGLSFSQTSMAMSRGGGGGHSGWQFMPSVMYLYESTKDSGTTTQTSRLLGNLDLGYVFQGSPFYLGVTYDYDSKTNSGSNSDKDTYGSYGGSLGLVTENIFMIFSYYFSSQYDRVRGNTTTSFTGGSGFSVALGYLFEVASSVSIGPELIYREVKYSKTSTGATADLTYDTVLPYLAINFMF